VDIQSYKGILRRTGIALLVVGLIDIGAMVYCIVRRISYSSSFNLFAVIAGILLIRGSLRAASGVRWFATFMLSSFVTLLVAWPVIQPIGLTFAQIRFNVGSFLAVLALAPFTLGFLYWLIVELRREPVQAARAGAGLKRRDMRLPTAVGVSLVVVTGIIMHVFLGGESAKRARSMAEKEVGPGYHFYVSSLRVVQSQHVKTVSGTVAAWNDQGVKQIPVHWEQARNQD
jgi:hypothetical protein